MTLRSRGYLPHLEIQEAFYFVTFRLADCLPGTILEALEFERKDIGSNANSQRRQLTDYEKMRLQQLYSEKVEAYLDKGRGDCWLRIPAIAEIVVNALTFFDEVRYKLVCWCVMPNHVHVVFMTLDPKNESIRNCELPQILHSWKSFTAQKANKYLSRTGTFWQREYYDHVIREDSELSFYVSYTLQNPVKAGLCKHWKDWPWSGCKLALQEDAGGTPALLAPVIRA